MSNIFVRYVKHQGSLSFVITVIVKPLMFETWRKPCIICMGILRDSIAVNGLSFGRSDWRFQSVSLSQCQYVFFLIASGGTLSQNHIMNFLWRPLGWILASESIESGSVWGISPMDCSKVQDYLEKLNLGARTALGAVQCVECRLDCPLRDRHVIPRRPHFQRCLCMTFEPGLQTNFSGRPMFGRWTSMKIL